MSHISSLENCYRTSLLNCGIAVLICVENSFWCLHEGCMKGSALNKLLRNPGGYMSLERIGLDILGQLNIKMLTREETEHCSLEAVAPN